MNYNITKKQNKTDYEPLLMETQRYCLYPIKYQHIFDMYNRQRAMFWIPSEIDLSKDRQDYNKLTEDEKNFINNILAFFAGTDHIVTLNIMENFNKDVKIMEAQMCYTYQAMIEGIHSEMYSLLIDTYINDFKLKNDLFNSIETTKTVKLKCDFALKYTDRSLTFAHRIVAFAIVEGLFFSSSFCSIYYFGQRNIMPGLIKSNEFIARDENMHVQFACLLYSMLNYKLDHIEIITIITEAVAIEIDFIMSTIPVKLIGMNSGDMIEYIHYVADKLLIDLGYPKLYNAICSFDFMINIGMPIHTNFFDVRNSSYQKVNISSSSQTLEIVDDF